MLLGIGNGFLRPTLPGELNEFLFAQTELQSALNIKNEGKRMVNHRKLVQCVQQGVKVFESWNLSIL